MAFKIKRINIMRLRDLKKLHIELRSWHTQCGDGCCDDYGTSLYLNGKKFDNHYAGDSAHDALELVLTELGYKVEIDLN